MAEEETKEGLACLSSKCLQQIIETEVFEQQDLKSQYARDAWDELKSRNE